MRGGVQGGQGVQGVWGGPGGFQGGSRGGPEVLGLPTSSILCRRFSVPPFSAVKVLEGEKGDFKPPTFQHANQGWRILYQHDVFPFPNIAKRTTCL